MVNAPIFWKYISKYLILLFQCYNSNFSIVRSIVLFSQNLMQFNIAMLSPGAHSSSIDIIGHFEIIDKSRKFKDSWGIFERFLGGISYI